VSIGYLLAVGEIRYPADTSSYSNGGAACVEVGQQLQL
jgi:hypothetical protein